MYSETQLISHILDVPDVDDPLTYERRDELFNDLSMGTVYNPAQKTMKVADLPIDLRVLRKVLEHIIFPKIGGTETVTEAEAQILWKLSHFEKISLPKLIVSSFHPTYSRPDLVIPYGMWMTRIFRYFGVYVEGESILYASEAKIGNIDETMLKWMCLTMNEYRSEQIRLQNEEDDEDDDEEEEEEGEGEEEGECEEGGTKDEPRADQAPADMEEYTPDPGTSEPMFGRNSGGAPPQASSSAYPPRSFAYTQLAAQMEQIDLKIDRLQRSLDLNEQRSQHRNAQIQLALDNLYAHFQLR